MKITADNTQLFWDKENKKFNTPNYYYDISECPTLTFTDDSNRFSFELKIDGLNVTVKPIYYSAYSMSFKFKDKLTLNIKSCPYVAINDIKLCIGNLNDKATYTFKSQKALTKFIGRLCRVKEVTSCMQ